MQKYLAIVPGLMAFFLASAASTPAQGKFEVSPFAGFETSGSYPVNPNSTGTSTNPIDRLRVNAATSYGTFLDYNLAENLQLEFMWDRNNTSYSARQISTGPTIPISTSFSSAVRTPFWTAVTAGAPILPRASDSLMIPTRAEIPIAQSLPSVSAAA